MTIVKQKTKRQQQQAGWLMIGAVLVIAALEAAGVNVLGLLIR